MQAASASAERPGLPNDMDGSITTTSLLQSHGCYRALGPSSLSYSQRRARLTLLPRLALITNSLARDLPEMPGLVPQRTPAPSILPLIIRCQAYQHKRNWIQMRACGAQAARDCPRLGRRSSTLQVLAPSCWKHCFLLLSYKGGWRERQKSISKTLRLHNWAAWGGCNWAAKKGNERCERQPGKQQRLSAPRRRVQVQRG